MKCRQARNQLLSFLYDELAEKNHGEVSTHIARCAPCSRELQELRETVQLCLQWPEERLGEDFAPNALLRAKPEILTPEELAGFLRVSVADLIENLDDIPHIKIGQSIRFRRTSVLKWLDETERTVIKKGFGQALTLVSPANRIKDFITD